MSAQRCRGKSSTHNERRCWSHPLYSVMSLDGMYIEELITRITTRQWDVTYGRKVAFSKRDNRDGVCAKSGYLPL